MDKLVFGECSESSSLVQLSNRFTEQSLLNERRQNENSEHANTSLNVNSFRMQDILQELQQSAQPSIPEAASSDSALTHGYRSPVHASSSLTNIRRIPQLLPPSFGQTDHLNWPSEEVSDEQILAAQALIVNTHQLNDHETATANDSADVGDSGEISDDFWPRLQEEWNTMTSQPDEYPWLSDYDNTETFNEYEFEKENPLMNHSSPFEQGLSCFEAGDVGTAILLFEAAVQQDPQNAMAWRYLGFCRAENEQDDLAIPAFRKCLDITPGDLTALMALAVSYTNESLQNQAIQTLNRWFSNNSRYSHLAQELPAFEASANPIEDSFSFASSSSLERSIEQFESARASSQRDVDLLCALGILYNLSGDYKLAAEAFSNALDISGNDAILWNRLGATQANGQRSEEAISAYTRALSISPNFVRCRYNLAIACLNLGHHQQAIDHLLECLHTQDSVRRDLDQLSSSLSWSSPHPLTSENIWSTLRLSLSMLGRPDLYESAANHDLREVERKLKETK